jgi:hypothetical protein
MRHHQPPAASLVQGGRKRPPASNFCDLRHPVCEVAPSPVPASNGRPDPRWPPRITALGQLADVAGELAPGSPGQRVREGRADQVDSHRRPAGSLAGATEHSDCGTCRRQGSGRVARRGPAGWRPWFPLAAAGPVVAITGRLTAEPGPRAPARLGRVPPAGSHRRPPWLRLAAEWLRTWGGRRRPQNGPGKTGSLPVSTGKAAHSTRPWERSCSRK